MSLSLATDAALGDCSRAALGKLTKSQLQDQLSKRGFGDKQLKGKKGDLVDRLFNVLHSAASAVFTKSGKATAKTIAETTAKAIKAKAKETAAADGSSSSAVSSSAGGKKRKRAESPLDQLFGPELAEALALRISEAKKTLSAPSTTSSSSSFSSSSSSSSSVSSSSSSASSSSSSDPLRTVEVEARLGTKRAFTEAEKQDRKRSGGSQKTELFEAGTSPACWRAIASALQDYRGWKDARGCPCNAPAEVTTYDIMFDAGGVSQRRERVRVELNGQGRAALDKPSAVIIKRKLGDT